MATTTLADTLQDYRAQLTGTENEAEPGHPTPTRVQVTARRPHTVSPPGWPQNYRRVPPFRPVNRNLDPAERPNGANVGEYVFVNVMLNGVRINSFLTTTYEKTFGRVYPGWTRYEIGGEW